MKIIYIVISLLISLNTFSQNCKEIENLNDSILLKNYGTCYINDPSNEVLMGKFIISPEMKRDDAGLIYLILNSKSMDADKEKESWFNLYPSMNKGQILKLYEILILEKKKLRDIEIKYEERKIEIEKKYLEKWKVQSIPKIDSNSIDVFTTLRNNKDKLSKFDYRFLGTHKGFNFPEVYEYDFDKDVLVSIYSDSLIVKPENFIFYKSISIYDKFDFVTAKYIQNTFLLEQEFQSVEVNYKRLFTYTLPSLSMDYLMFGLRYFYKERMFKELGELLIIDPQKLSHCKDMDKMKEFTKVYNIYNASYNSTIKNYMKSCISERYNLLNGDYDDIFNNKKSIVFEMFEASRYNANNCEKCGDDINSYIVEKLQKNSLEQIQLGNEIQTELMQFDFIKLFNSNDQIKYYAEKISNNIFETKSYQNREDYKDEWSFIMTNKYVDNELPYFENLQSLNDYADTLIKTSKSNLNIQLYESTLFEFYSYYLLYCYSHNKINNINIGFYNSIVNEANRIGNNSSLEAYYFIEKSIVDAIAKKLSTSTKNNTNSIKIYSIIIGISDYKNLELSSNFEMNDLKYAEKDAKDFANYLEKTFGTEITQYVLTKEKATSVSIKRKIQETLINRVSEDDIVYIYFSGHGRTTYANENYLLGYDFDINDEFSGIEFEWFTKQIRDSKAKQIFTFVDACKSGLLSLNKGDSSSQLYLNELDMYDSHKIIITSSSNSQNSFEDDNLKNGIFTYYLLKGLNGDCKNSNNDAFVRLSDLREYLIENVFKYKKQIPDVTGKLIDDNIPISIRKNK